jgi:hypothetical protein
MPMGFGEPEGRSQDSPLSVVPRSRNQPGKCSLGNFGVWGKISSVQEPIMGPAISINVSLLLSNSSNLSQSVHKIPSETSFFKEKNKDCWSNV